MNIKNTKDLKVAYSMIQLIEDSIEQTHKEGHEVKNLAGAKATIDGLKRDIREYYKMQDERDEVTIVRDFGADGFISLYELPQVDNPVEYFEQNERITINSPYDCTGKPFTLWYKIFRRNNRTMVYHRIGIDC